MIDIYFKLYYKGEAVGYERHSSKKPWGSVYISHSIDSSNWYCVTFDPDVAYIKHDDKAQFIGLTNKDGRRMYFKNFSTHGEICV